jgi:hypothetical protein
MAAAVAGWPLRMSQAPAAAMLPIPSATGIGLADRAAPGYRQYGSRDLDRPNLPCFRRDPGKGDLAPVPWPGIAWQWKTTLAQDRQGNLPDDRDHPALPPSTEILRRAMMPARRAAALSGGRPLWAA